MRYSLFNFGKSLCYKVKKNIKLYKRPQNKYFIKLENVFKTVSEQQE